MDKMGLSSRVRFEYLIECIKSTEKRNKPRIICVYSITSIPECSYLSLSYNNHNHYPYGLLLTLLLGFFFKILLLIFKAGLY